jgi:hypothetical protein
LFWVFVQRRKKSYTVVTVYVTTKHIQYHIYINNAVSFKHNRLARFETKRFSGIENCLSTLLALDKRRQQQQQCGLRILAQHHHSSLSTATAIEIRILARQQQRSTGSSISASICIGNNNGNSISKSNITNNSRNPLTTALTMDKKLPRHL